MKLRIFGLSLLLAGGALPSLADQASAWNKDPQHPALEYRVKCRRETAVVEWRSSYPGSLTLRTAIKSHAFNDSYDGAEDVTVAPGSVTETSLETMACAPGAFQIRVTHFEMAPPAPASRPGAAAVAAKMRPPAPTVAPYVPPVDDLPAVSPEAIAAVTPGMKQREVERRLGPPASKLTIPEPGEFIETYRYQVANSRSSIVRFENGVVTDISTR